MFLVLPSFPRPDGRREKCALAQAASLTRGQSQRPRRGFRSFLTHTRTHRRRRDTCSPPDLRLSFLLPPHSPSSPCNSTLDEAHRCTTGSCTAFCSPSLHIPRTALTESTTAHPSPGIRTRIFLPRRFILLSRFYTSIAVRLFVGSTAPLYPPPQQSFRFLAQPGQRRPRW
jgi:hypothetical protein